MAETLQHEGTWEVSDAFVLPNIEGVVADAELHRESTESVGAYYDTADLDLVAHGITLRPHDDGDRCRWRLSLRTGAPSIELTSKSSGLPPAELTHLLMAVTSGKELGDVVSVRTARELYRISRREDEDSYAAWSMIGCSPPPQIDWPCGARSRSGWVRGSGRFRNGWPAASKRRAPAPRVGAPISSMCCPHSA